MPITQEAILDGSPAIEAVRVIFTTKTGFRRGGTSEMSLWIEDKMLSSVKDHVIERIPPSSNIHGISVS